MEWEDGKFALKYKRGFVFSEWSACESQTAGYTEIDPPVPRPPEKEYEKVDATKTIAAYPHLFKITTPIKVDELEKSLKTHPNQEFVQSVMRALREGFWRISLSLEIIQGVIRDLKWNRSSFSVIGTRR